MAGRNILSALVLLARPRLARLLLPALLVWPGPAGAQPPPSLTSQVAEQNRAVELYLSGDTTGAMRLLDQRRLDEQREVVDRILMLARIRSADATGETAPWTRQKVNALAALHMEAALHAYGSRDATAKLQARAHIKLAESLFAFVAAQQSNFSSDRRWELALALMALADGELGWAEWFLEPACRQFPNDAPLLVACGILDETRAALMATTPYVRPTDDALRRYRAMRADRLKQAERLLERALKSSPSNIEARLRLAHVRMMQGRDRAAAPLLEEIESGRIPADARGTYLALLFLGEIRVRARQAESAAALFRRASTVIPPGSTALIALAHVAHTRGDAQQAAEILERVVSTSNSVVDPWWGYRFGPYWMRDALLASLRAELRQ